MGQWHHHGQVHVRRFQQAYTGFVVRVPVASVTEQRWRWELWDRDFSKAPVREGFSYNRKLAQIRVSRMYHDHYAGRGL